MSSAGPKNGVENGWRGRELLSMVCDPQENLCREAQEHIPLAFDLSSFSWGPTELPDWDCLSPGMAGLWLLPKHRLQSCNRENNLKRVQISCSEMPDCFFMFLLIFRSFLPESPNNIK